MAVFLDTGAIEKNLRGKEQEVMKNPQEKNWLRKGRSILPDYKGKTKRAAGSRRCTPRAMAAAEEITQGLSLKKEKKKKK